MIDITNESGSPADEEGLVGLATFALDWLRIHPSSELSIILIDEQTMEAYHEKFMGLPGPTDVLSFPMDELRPGTEDRPTAPGLLGDIVLCPQVAETQAREAQHSLMDELVMLTTHGLLHLLGFDHADAAEEREMFGLQRDLIAGFAAAERRRPRR